MVAQELIGTWAIEMPLPWIESDHCRTDCGRLVTFESDGSGFITTGRADHVVEQADVTFTWMLDDTQTLALLMPDGHPGIIEVGQHLRYEDGISELVVTTVGPAGEQTGDLLPHMQAFVFDSLPGQGLVDDDSGTTTADIVTDDERGVVLDVSATPLPVEGALTGVSLGAAFLDCCNRVEYLGGDLYNKTLTFDVKLLEPETGGFAVTAKLDVQRNVGTKYVGVPLAASEEWQTVSVDMIQLAPPAKLYVNGEQITSFDTNTQNGGSSGHFNNTVQHVIGGNCDLANSSYFDGHMSQFYWIDGQTLDASYY